ncbi:hypothetical protein BGZ73_001435 [Actinomortierella ambigua]|nr:hypothetical protein BGZ73_001435 [Actinomortierella ambigua]
MGARSFDVTFESVQSAAFVAYLWETVNTPTCQLAILALIAHVANYNLTARLEHNTRVFTKVLGKNAIYFYAVYLLLSAYIRDQIIHKAVLFDIGSFVLFPEQVATYLGAVTFVLGFLLNLWTLKALGIKGMYNGDSFGHLMDAPVVDGPYTYFQDPQYVGTTMAMLGTAIYYQSLAGYVLTIDMYIVFWISVLFFEGPHMNRIYAEKAEREKQKTK